MSSGVGNIETDTSGKLTRQHRPSTHRAPRLQRRQAILRIHANRIVARLPSNCSNDGQGTEQDSVKDISIPQPRACHRIRMYALPVPGNGFPGGYPYLVVAMYMGQEIVQSTNPAGAAHDPQV